MTDALENPSSVETAVAELATDLYEIFSTAESLSSPAACEQVIGGYLQKVGRIGMLARGAGLDGVHESCFHFYQILQSVGERGRLLSKDELDLLEQWPFVIGACLDTNNFCIETVESLLDYFRNESWPVGLPGHAANDIYDAYRRQSEDQKETATAGDALEQSLPDYPELDRDLISALEQEMLDATNTLFDDLSNADEPGSCDTITGAFDLFAERLELMLMSIADAGIDGLVEACTLFQANLRRLGQRATSLSLEEGQTLSAWPSLVIHYLENPRDTAAIEALVDFLSKIPAANPLTAEEHARLCQRLADAEPPVAQAAPEAEPAVPAGDSATNDITSSPQLHAPEEIAVATVAEGIEDSDTLGELVQLVRTELVFVADEFSAAMTAFSNDNDIEARTKALDNHAEMVERLRLATESMGLSGLSQVLSHIYQNVDQLVTQGAAVADIQLTHLQHWPEMVLAYLDGLCDGLGSQPLVDYLQAQHWAVAIDPNSLDDLLQQLQSPDLSVEDEFSEPRQTRADKDDVSLELPEDINPQLIDSLLQELPGHTAEFNMAINRLIDGDGTFEDVDIAQRVAHTLKGSANTVGIRGIANLTHHIEDILLAFARHGRLPGRALAGTLLEAADVLEMMSESLLGMGPSPEQALPILQSVLDWANRIDRDGIDKLEDTDTRAATPSSAEQPENETSRKTGKDTAAMLRVPADMVDDLLRLVGESIILTGQLQNRLSLAESQTASVRSQHTLFQQLTAELDHLVETQGLTGNQTRDSLQEEFDSLELEHYNELHTVTHRLVEAATDASELTAGIEDHLAVLDDLLIDQHTLLKDEQALVMRTRMLPVQTIVPRLQRAVRQAGRQTHKQVQLAVHGADTMIDSQVLNDLVDPLTHLLRNAVDHGIEDAAQRPECGKPECGNIAISFDRQGDHIVVTCEDDGAGLDHAAIRAAAQTRRLLSEDETADEDALNRLILIPGFSTRSETTQVSGRGIGMDAVNTRINEMKGTLRIESATGEGCRIELRLPLSLISVHALLVPASEHCVAVSSRGIDQILYPGAGKLERDGDQLTFYSEEQSYPAWHIESLLQMPVPADAEQSGDRPVLLVRDENSTVFAVCVSSVLATEDLVVKQLGAFVPRLAGIEGATILGDGSVAPVADLPILLGIATEDTHSSHLGRPVRQEPRESRPCAMVVDDSLSARRSLAEFMQDLGYEVLTARDGLEAIETMDERIPQVALVDLEMPRMNGLELAAHIRAQNRTRNLPIIMITSRSTEKHRQKAQAAGINAYLTKPFSEDTLNDQILAVTEMPQQNLA